MCGILTELRFGSHERVEGTIGRIRRLKGSTAQGMHVPELEVPMAHASMHGYDLSPEQALREIKAERRRRSYIALIVFALSGVAIIASFYLSYR
jgi:hypothetical protein